MRGKFLFGAALLFGLGANAFAQGADQAGDNNTAARLSPGQAVDGEISPAGDRDWFRLSVEPGQRYSITLDAAGEAETPLDPVLALYGADGQSIAENDDSNGSLNSALRYSPTAAGDIFVEARGFTDQAVGAYRLSVEAGPAPADDVGNDAASRGRVTAGNAVSGVLESEGDVDWYRLSARVGQRYRINLSGADGSNQALGDPMLRVVAGDGAELASNDDSENSLNSMVEWTPSQNGDVFVEASAFGGAAIGAYTLSVAAERAPTDAIAGSRVTHGRIALGGSVTNALDFVGDTDWWRIRLQEGQTYRFTLSGNKDATTPLADPVLAIRNASGEELATDDDGGEGFNSYLEFTAPSSGQFYLEARPFGADMTGGYTLTAAQGDIPADASTDATLSAEGDYREGALSPTGDKDWYRLNLTEGQGLRITVTSAEGETGLGDPLVVLYGPDGAEVARDDDSGEGLNAWLEYVAATAGAYHLEVRGFSEEIAEGRYAIQITPGEIGASADSAESISVNSEGRSSTISPTGDNDWFAIDLVEGRSYRFNLEAADGALDPLITLYDANGQAVATDDDGGAGTNAYLTYVSVTGGTYYVGASAFNNATAGAYTLRVTDSDVPGNTGTDEVLAAGDDRLSRIDMPGDLDNYRVDLEAGVRYLIEVKGEGDNPLADAFLAVLNSSGERVTSDDDGGDGLDARLRFTPETNDMYYIQASGLGGSTGWYRVSITRE